MSTLQRRQFITRVGQTAGLVILGATLKNGLVGCSGNVTESNEISSSPAPVPSSGLMIPGNLQWGGEATSGAPYVFYNPQSPAELIGFEVEIAQALAEQLGAKPTFLQTSYAQLGASLAANRFDMIMNGWEIDADREKTQIFSVPYYRYGQQIVVRADDERFAKFNTDSEMSLADLAGMTVGTGLGYKAQEILESYPNLTPRTYDGNLPFDDLIQKRIDAVFIDSPIVAYYVLGSGPGGTVETALKPIGKPFYLNNYVLAFNKNSPKAETLKAEIDQALGNLKTNGTLKGIYEKWKMWNSQQAEIGIS
ncbi:ABC transporter substrate-binding protein [Thermosynechococcaceae cyanobacterium BACA0444]|uniref:ABC transporter substrate-binding protein n=1 Tax=Pseudocalidococcus azoricus BACA0444 TaxID=2918990 RepID=A0AAE4JVN0_9CYAN|nr:ABC transporter substrate-binding protein [Pseudocalidococcus azoricus]MDS3860231.1 ABC transporter substrate-binding protein [Pseudocalidococcus azoricus BACA0444]